MIFTQLEVGSFIQFFPLPFQQCGNLAAPSFCIQIWKETQPYGVSLQPVEQVSWIPFPLAEKDIALSELAMKSYNGKGAQMINRC